MTSKSSLLDRSIRFLGGLLIVLLCWFAISLNKEMRKASIEADDQGFEFTTNLRKLVSYSENWFYDIRSRHLYNHRDKSPHLVVVEIGDQSLNEIGRWPWTRTKHAQIIENLKAYGAKVIMMDMLFPEPEAGADDAFARAIADFTRDGKHSLIVGYEMIFDPSKKLETVPVNMITSAINGRVGKPGSYLPNYIDKFNFITPVLLENGASMGFINSMADTDGIFRNARLVGEIDGSFYPSLGFAGFNAYFSDGDKKKLSVNAEVDSYELIKEDGQKVQRIPLSDLAELKVRFHGGADAFQTVPIEKIYFDKDPSKNTDLINLFKDKAVIVGSTAFGAHDLRHTPVSPALPGMYLHANMFHDLDTDYFYVPEKNIYFLSILILFLGVLSVIGISFFQRPIFELFGTCAILFALFGVDYFVLAPQGYFLRLFFALTGILLLYIWFTVLNLFQEAKEKKKIRDTFQRYVSPEIVKEVLAHPEKLGVGGVKKEITMMFSDVRDFTTMSEKLTPQNLALLLNIYMDKMTNIVFETRGTLDKYIGDAIVCFWGAPLDIPDHAYLSVVAAKRMLDALPVVNKIFEEKGLPQIKVGIGVNTGEVSVGNMGSKQIVQYTALGDHMNLASRLEGLTKSYGVGLMISEFTVDALGERKKEFHLRPLDFVQVKGKTKPVKVFEVLAPTNPFVKDPNLMALFVETYENLYLKRNFKDAAKGFREILAVVPDDRSSTRLLNQTEEFLKNPPPDDWQGATIFHTK